MKKRVLRNLFLYWLSGLTLLMPAVLGADDPPEVLSLNDTVKMALDANLNLKQSQEEVKAAELNRRASITQFFPTLSASYDYLHRNREQTQELTGLVGQDFIVRPDDEYTFVTSFNQPVFRGFSLINQYRIADLGLDAAEFSAKITRQDVILDAQNAFYSVLKTLKLLEVAKQRVNQIAAQKEHSVFARSAIQSIAEGRQERGLGPRQHRQPIRNDLQRVGSLATKQQVAGTTIETSSQHVLPRAAKSPILAQATSQHIVAAAAQQHVPPRKLGGRG